MPQALSDVWRYFTAANVEGKAVYICKYRIIWPILESSLSAQNKQPLTKVLLLLFEVKMMALTPYR